jgi:hypothetical protein
MNDPKTPSQLKPPKDSTGGPARANDATLSNTPAGGLEDATRGAALMSQLDASLRAILLDES